MKYILLIFLMLISQPIMLLDQRFTVELGNPIKDDIEAVVEAPVRVGVDEEELHCMTLALYKESRGEPERGSILVAQVILNRKESQKFKNSICEVVKRKLKGRCMFSFWCTDNREVVNDIEQYKRLTQVAYDSMLGKYKGITKATYFKRCDFKSNFFNKLKYLGRIGNHCFYEEYSNGKKYN